VVRSDPIAELHQRVIGNGGTGQDDVRCLGLRVLLPRCIGAAAVRAVIVPVVAPQDRRRVRVDVQPATRMGEGRLVWMT